MPEGSPTPELPVAVLIDDDGAFLQRVPDGPPQELGVLAQALSPEAALRGLLAALAGWPVVRVRASAAGRLAQGAGAGGLVGALQQAAARCGAGQTAALTPGGTHGDAAATLHRRKRSLAATRARVVCRPSCLQAGEGWLSALAASAPLCLI
ncbi:unnamed protein product [Prorocentrum cordatum]|uniref:Uncharacterized protein n=1 Tax=Prorocentrum cordatum TaxID=2364126 RepID=A0ABN9U741_9DINO|nr:unnamed protein product [Polarella glacialis]